MTRTPPREPVSAPKKHHHVPQFLLRYFASGAGQFRVYRTDHDRTYLAQVQNRERTSAVAPCPGRTRHLATSASSRRCS